MVARTGDRDASRDLVPLADRVRTLALFRVAALAVVAGLAVLQSASWSLDPLRSVVVGSAYTALATGVGALAVRGRRRNVPVVTALLLLDAIALAWASYATGGADSPVRYLIVLHVVVVSLGVSHRTGVKIALWDALLILVIEEAQRVELLAPTSRLGDDLPGFLGAVIVAAIVASAASAVNERELRRRRIDLDALAAMATELERTSETREVAHIAVEAIADNFDLSRVALLEVRAGQVDVLGASGTAPTGGPGSLADAASLEEAAATRRTLLVSELRNDDVWLSRLFPEAHNLIVMPLAAEDEVNAVLVVEHGLRRGSRVEGRVVTALERFGAHVALSLVNADLHRSLAAMAMTDGLTHLANRRAFDDALTTELERTSRLDVPISLALVDIDRFKRVNDQHGHLVGDKVLVAVADTIRRTARAVDVPARFGGEEFAVILTGTGPADAEAAAERLRRAIAAAPSPVPVTVTIGVAASASGITSADELIQAADLALYRGKEAGRNRVTLETLGHPGRLESFERTAGASG